MDKLFQPTRPLRGATAGPLNRHYHKGDFNPRAPCGARRLMLPLPSAWQHFNPRAPCGARLASVILSLWLVLLFQPTRPLRGATGVSRVCIRTTFISTHAPLAGRDLLTSFVWLSRFNFNPRAPCGARPCLGVTRAHYIKFQPTRPLRGATNATIRIILTTIKFQPTRPLRGATDDEHVPVTYYSQFQPTRPLRGATLFSTACSPILAFQPTRPLRGATPRPQHLVRESLIFQPTRPLRGATPVSQNDHRRYPISTHAPLAGRDSNQNELHRHHSRFQPTRPLRGATETPPVQVDPSAVFQPTRPLRGATAKVYKSLCTFLR